MHPLDFQDDWQASEPVPVDIFYTVPGALQFISAQRNQMIGITDEIICVVNGESDLRKALERANDAARALHCFVAVPNTSVMYMETSVLFAEVLQ